MDIAPSGSLSPGRWWEPHEIARAWPDLLDATSGHLPTHLLRDLAVTYDSTKVTRYLKVCPNPGDMNRRDAQDYVFPGD